MIHEMARGHDDRLVQTADERRSVGAETTFARDLPDGPELRRALTRIAGEVAERLAHHQTRARTIAVKLRYANFRTITRQVSRAEPTDSPEEISSAAKALLDKVTQEGDRFRLLGIHATNLAEGRPDQLSLWSQDAGAPVEAG